MKSEAWLDFKEFVAVNKRLVIACVISIAGLLALQGYIGGAATECLGIADSKETTVAFEVPVVVKRIFVLPGQVVKKGQPLLEVEPAETNLKLLEVQTALEALKSEQKVRETLLRSFNKKAALGDNPIAMEVAGLQSQVDELKRQQSNSVRYAEEDGVVATVSFRPREQVSPFIPVITLTSSVPNLVYGFIHEARLAEFQIGDQVIIEPVNGKSRRTTGKVISVGNRIAPFPERFQIGSQQRPTYFGREVVVSLNTKNHVLIGEKVSIRSDNQIHFSDFGFQAFADSQSEVVLNSVTLAEGLPLEAGGLLYLPATDSLLVASDDNGPLGSPFWMMNLKDPAQVVNLPLSGVSEVDDVESLTSSQGRVYAMSSLTPNKRGRIKTSRNLVLRLTADVNGVNVDRALDIRLAVVEGLKRQPLLRAISGELENVEVEAFSMDGADAYIGLKGPQLPDGSSVILKLRGFADQIEANRVGVLDMEVAAMIKLESKQCDEPGRITDISRVSGGLVILSNCSKAEKAGQVWYLSDNSPQQQASLVSSLRNGRAEGLAFGADSKTLFITSDNGKKKGSDFLKIDNFALP